MQFQRDSGGTPRITLQRRRHKNTRRLPRNSTGGVNVAFFPVPRAAPALFFSDADLQCSALGPSHPGPLNYAKKQERILECGEMLSAWSDRWRERERKRNDDESNVIFPFFHASFAFRRSQFQFVRWPDVDSRCVQWFFI